MYRKQMKLQRIVCLLSVIAAAVVFIYSLGMMTDLHDMLNNSFGSRVEGAGIYQEMQPFNRLLLRGSIGLILIACLLFVTNTHSRRKYYIGNYCAVALVTAANLAAAVWAHLQIAAWKTQFLTTIDFEALENRLRRLGTFTKSTFWFDVHWVVFGLLAAVTVLLVASTIWKVRLMRDERSLLAEGKGTGV